MTYGYLFQFCFALAVLNSPAAPPPELFKLVNRPIVAICLYCEILDHREVRYVLVKPEEFIGDVRMLRRRVNDLPPDLVLDDCYRFPERCVVNELLLFNRAYRQYLEDCTPIYPNNAELRAAKEETEILYRIWDCVRDAKCEYYYVHIRRQALKRLYDMLGETDYRYANLPPHVPTWRFVPIR